MMFGHPYTKMYIIDAFLVKNYIRIKYPKIIEHLYTKMYINKN